MRFGTRGAAIAAALAVATVVAPALPVAAGDGSDYRGLANAASGDYGRGIGITASFSGRIHGADVELPEGRIEFKADLRSGKAKLEVNIRLGDLAPLAQSYGVGAQDQKRLERIKFTIFYSPSKGLYGKGPLLNDVASAIAPKARANASSEGWIQIATPEQAGAVVASVVGAASAWSAQNVSAQDAGFGALATGLSGYGVGLTDNGDRSWTASIDPKAIAGVLDAYAGPILLANGGDPLAKPRVAGDLAAQGAEVMRHTDGMSVTIRTNGDSRKVNNVELRYRGEVDNQRADARLRLQVRGLGDLGEMGDLGETSNSVSVAPQIWAIACGVFNVCG